MLASVLIGSVLMLLTTVVHASAMMLMLRVAEITHAQSWAAGARWRRPLVVAAVVIGMFVAAVIESGLWAATYLLFKAIPEVEPALYFSTVTYTTLGYGDVTLETPYRLLSSFQAANGTIMFGWTTAVIVWVVQHLYAPVVAQAARTEETRDV